MFEPLEIRHNGIALKQVSQAHNLFNTMKEMIAYRVLNGCDPSTLRFRKLVRIARKTGNRYHRVNAKFFGEDSQYIPFPDDGVTF